MKRTNFLPYFVPTIEDDEVKEVVDTLKSGWLTQGPKTIEFERLIAEYSGAKYAVCVNSCTAALHLSLIGLGIGPGDEVITSPYTFGSTANVIVHTGAKPVFADICKDTYNINPEEIEKAITFRTKAIIPVHFAGQPCDLKRIHDIAHDKGIFVIEDAAHAIGAEFEGTKIGSLSDTTCFSFYATKNITTGEGGAITTNNEELADKLRILRLHGISKDAWKRYSAAGSWYYEIEACGYKCNMTDLQAALGIHQIKKLDKFVDARRRYAHSYNREFEDISSVVTPFESPNVKHPYHLYPILIQNFDRNLFIERMKEENIGTSVHFIPLHLHPYYRDTFGFKKGDFPIAEMVYEHEVSLPLYPKMKEEDVIEVSNIVLSILQE